MNFLLPRTHAHKDGRTDRKKHVLSFKHTHTHKSHTLADTWRVQLWRLLSLRSLSLRYFRVSIRGSGRAGRSSASGQPGSAVRIHDGKPVTHKHTHMHTI